MYQRTPVTLWDLLCALKCCPVFESFEWKYRAVAINLTNDLIIGDESIVILHISTSVLIPQISLRLISILPQGLWSIHTRLKREGDGIYGQVVGIGFCMNCEKNREVIFQMILRWPGCLIKYKIKIFIETIHCHASCTVSRLGSKFKFSNTLILFIIVSGWIL